MDMWCDMGHMSNLSKLEKRGLKKDFLGRKHHISSLTVIERERKKEKKKKNPNFSFRFTKFCRSEFVRPRTKVHLLNEG